MKRLWKKSIAGILGLVLCVGLLSTAAFAAEDKIVVIRDSVEVEDLAIDGELYIAQDAQLVTTGEVTIHGDVYVYGSWRNTGEISGEGTIHCLYYNSASFALDAAGHFSSTTNTGGSNPLLTVSFNDSYLNTPIPEGYTYDPETGETSGPEAEEELNAESADETDDTTDSGAESPSDSVEHTYDFDNIDWHWTLDYSAANACVYCVDSDGAVKTYEAEIASCSNDYGGVTLAASIVGENGNVYSDQIVLDADGNSIDLASDTDGAVSMLSAGSGRPGSTGSGHTGSGSGSGRPGSTGSAASSGSTDSGDSTDSSGSGHTGSGSGHTDSGAGSGRPGSSGSGHTDSSSDSDSGSSDSGSGSGFGSGSSGSGFGFGSGNGTGSSGTGSSDSGSGHGSSGGTSSSGIAAKTDDSAMPYLYLTLILAAGAAVVTFSVRRRVTKR